MNPDVRTNQTADVSLFQLEGKSALVVGGGPGMGESTAKLLARVGCGVAVAGRRPEPVERVAAAVRALGQPAAAIVGDVLDDAQAQDIVAQAQSALGAVDLLVTIIGGATFNPIIELTPE